jgi:hypothetical protein
MSVAIPIVLFVLLAATFVMVPRIGPLRARRRCRETALGLAAGYGFSSDSRTTQLSELSSLPPFHYGIRRQVRDAIEGSFAGLPAEVFTYTCSENNTAHWYQVAVVRLGRTLPPFEVQYEQPFSSTKVTYSPANALRATGVEAFDTAYRINTPDDRLADTMVTPGLARALLATPEPFGWRIEGGLLVLWRRDGWTNSATLVDCCLTSVHSLAPVLDLDPELFDAPRSAPRNGVDRAGGAP